MEQALSDAVRELRRKLQADDRNRRIRRRWLVGIAAILVVILSVLAEAIYLKGVIRSEPCDLVVGPIPGRLGQ
ncbi:hypothetical protein [Sphingomonas quercus]|uniref:Uncharacterized protein n=1 Tax=Sphingomonas quercus TaxID=2842451 RepID=A0ABS6BIZ9_9SPHN|nr:hypothetical protein [Sphingomonas quercus]MBU3077817.1 hypothetical protein [Sphingomonas quercus]